jgi:hypothetical protein
MLLGAGLVLALLPPAVVRGAVRVVEDEVIFTLSAPGAGDVYLVGDFNNWNATLEGMDKTDGTFEVYLFLLPGTYRYKFVVDGEWTTDPDNPPPVPADGSLLVLEERAGMLVLGAAEETREEEAVLLEPSGRYSGAFILEDNKTSSRQALDFYFKHASKRANAKVNFKTIDDTWDLSPLTATIDFDRGYLDLSFGETSLKAFENDTLWTSSDPFSVFGRVGVYDYNAGYERRGASFELPLVLNTELKGLYTDKIGRRLGPPLKIGAEPFAGMASADTVVYRYRDTYEDTDTWGFEFLGDLGSFRLGYTKRENRGFNPGLLVEADRRADDGIATTTFTTREFFNADAVWLRWTFWRELALSGGYGWGDAEIRSQDQSASPDLELPWVTIGQETEPADRRIPFQKSKRVGGAIEYDFAKSRIKASYQWNEYEFDARAPVGSAVPVAPTTPVGSAASPNPAARISVAGLVGEYGEGGWDVFGELKYIDQNYGDTPVEFDYFTPARNFWLDYLDKLTVENMVAFDLRRTTQLSVLYSADESVLPGFFGTAGERPTVILLAGGLATREFFEKIEYGFFRFGIEHTFLKWMYAQWDSRLAWYDKSSWNLNDTFFSTYLETGYRNKWAEISFGFGLDPNVLDPVVNVYADIGREEFLRGALFDGLTRDDAAILGARLGEQERRLADLRAFKLEVILFF